MDKSHCFFLKERLHPSQPSKIHHHCITQHNVRNETTIYSMNKSAKCILIVLTPSVSSHVPAADLIGQPLEVLWQVGILVSIGDDLDALVEHVVTQLLELAHVLSSYEHEVFQVRLVFHGLQEQSLEGGVVHCAPAAQKHKGFGLIQLLDLTLLRPAVVFYYYTYAKATISKT